MAAPSSPRGSRAGSLGLGCGHGALSALPPNIGAPFCLTSVPPVSSATALRPLPGQEEEIPELEIDVDELLDMESDDTRAARVKELLVDCYKPTEAFISGLLDKIRGMQKLSTPQKK
ncbi:PREDICTED: protein phosphatase 1 regulatory subunit 14B [Myotis brandtii]|uniref:protein phosphatase 1 regulatory subunit 14B n=1 Tax=Myotis brandtii TaxID=109478 RepID=UPI0003BB9A3C|nr:PREDICTED: protein phosphatase 1 regulatory subunit 14B [Myotis brandtii]